jgi:hypothetical protein
MTIMSTTPCGHQFCTPCLLQAFRQKSVCPCCRTALVPTEEEDEDEDEDEDSNSEFFAEDAVPVAPIETVIQALQKEGISYNDLVSLLVERHADGQPALDALLERVDVLVDDLDFRTGQEIRYTKVLAQIPMVAAVWGYREEPVQVAEQELPVQVAEQELPVQVAEQELPVQALEGLPVQAHQELPVLNTQGLPVLDIEELLEQEEPVSPKRYTTVGGLRSSINSDFRVVRPHSLIQRLEVRLPMHHSAHEFVRTLYPDAELPTIYELFRRIT